MINKLRIFILLLVLGVCAVSSVSYAAECSEEVKQQAREKAKADAKASCETWKQDGADYNSKVQDYLNNCDQTAGGAVAVVPDNDVISAAEQIEASISDPALYQYRGIQWSQKTAPAEKSGCSEKLEQIKAAQLKYEATITNTQTQLRAVANPSMTRCECDENGVPTCSVVNENTGEIQADGGSCEVTGFLNALSSCPLCPVFEVVMKTNADIAHIAWEAVSEPLSHVVGIFFLVLLAFEALKTVAAIGGTKPSALMKGILVLGLKIAITIGLLSSSQYIYGMFISPIAQGGMDMGVAVANASGGSGCTIDSVGPVSSAEISPELINSVLSRVRCFSEDAAQLPAIGMGLICISTTFSMLISGLIMFLFGIMIWMAFSFYLIDATVQLGMLCALVPLLIACWPFEMTKQYTAKGVKMLMNTFFTFAFAGVMIMLAVNYVTAAITGGGTVSTNELINAINNNDEKSMEILAAIEGSSIMTLLACGFFAMKMISKVSGLANQFSSGSGMSAGAKIGGLAASAASSAGKWAGGKTVQLGKAGLSELGNNTRIGRAVQRGARSTMGAIQRGHGKLWAGIGKYGMGLGRFQNRKAGTGTQQQGTEEENGRNAMPEDQKNQQNAEDALLNNQNTEAPEDENTFDTAEDDASFDTTGDDATLDTTGDDATLDTTGDDTPQPRNNT